MSDLPNLSQAAAANHQAGRPAEAETLYRQILQQVPDDPDELFLLGSLALSPTNAVAHHNLGVLLHKQGKIDYAITHYRKAGLLDPDHAVAYCSLTLGIADE